MMNTAAKAIKRQAQKKILALFRNKFPASQGDFFTAVETANKIINNFYDEIVENDHHMTSAQKEDYHLGLISIFENIKFKVNSADLDIILKNHGEDFSTFPDISNPELKEKLSMNLIAMGKAEARKITIEKVVENKELQKECLWFYFSIQKTEILRSLRKVKDQSGTFKINPQFTSSHSNISHTSRLIEKQFFLILNQDLNYLDSTPSGLKGEMAIKEESGVLLRKTKNLKLQTIEEVSDNLLHLSLENATTYLKRLLQDINKMISSFEKKEFYFLNHQNGKFVEVEFQVQLQERPDIIESLRYLNSCRLEMSKNLRKMIEMRMDLYQEIRNNDTLTRNTVFTAKQCAYALDEVGFFELPKIKDQPKTRISKFIGAISGASAKNIKTGIEERHIRKGKNATPHQKKDNEYVNTWFKENLT